MLRSHTCGELRIEDAGKEVTLAGWVKIGRNQGHLIFVDVRDRYGVTQLSFNRDDNAELCDEASKLGREFVIKATGIVTERSAKNPNMPTGNIEIKVTSLDVLNTSKTPPFTIDDDTDGGEELRMQYRYLDLRRDSMRKKLMIRHRIAIETRKYLDSVDFLEVETPYLIKSTPEGARDFVVPSRMNPGQFYALPQSPQTFKQLLMVSGFDRYYQVVKCFRDEDLRADRQPEFTQLDCEMAFVTQEDILQTFETWCRHIFKVVRDIEVPEFARMDYADAMRLYGSDKPDLRFDMQFVEMNEIVKGVGFKVLDDAEFVAGICAPGCAGYSRKDTDKLIDWVKRPQIGASGMIFCKHLEDGTFKSSVDKFYDQEQLQKWANAFGSKPGDLMLLLAGNREKTQKALGELRLEMGNRCELRDPNKFACLWVTDFPLLEWDEDSERYHAMHHPFTSPKPEDIHMMETEPGKVRANAYDMVINGAEIGGGSIRIHDRALQSRMFDLLGFTKEEAQAQFGFLLNAFEYGAPPHGGAAFGFDRLCAILAGQHDIKDFIAFPKNNSGRDVMIDAPAPVDDAQMKELFLQSTVPAAQED
jgi:aspartyl-tRNA synthetase